MSKIKAKKGGKTAVDSPKERIKDMKSSKLKKTKKTPAVLAPLSSNAKPAKKHKTDKKQKKKLQQVVAKQLEAELTPETPITSLASADTIRKAIIAVRKGTEEECKEKKRLFDKDFRYGIQICAHKIPQCPSRNARMLLPNALFSKSDDICLIVKDDVVGKKQDHEQTVNRWEALLREHNIDFIRRILPIGQLKQDYQSYEMKRKLMNSYDHFLCDVVVSGHAFHILGKKFILARKNPTPVKLADLDNLKTELELGIRKVTYKQTSHGITTEIPVATHKLSVEEFVENVETTLNQLQTVYPGGWTNVKSVYLKPMQPSKVSLPLYVSDADPNTIPVPVVIGPRQKKREKLEKQLESSKRFALTKDFAVVKKPKAKKEKVIEKTEEKTSSPESMTNLFEEILEKKRKAAAIEEKEQEEEAPKALKKKKKKDKMNIVSEEVQVKETTESTQPPPKIKKAKKIKGESINLTMKNENGKMLKKKQKMK